MSTEQFVAALTEYQLDPTEIAEVLWLALKLPPVEADDTSDEDNPVDDDDAPSGDDTGDGADTDEVEDTDLNDQDDEESDDTSDDSFPIVPELPSGILPQQALPISIPDADILDDTLLLVRALKPLLKQIESQVNSYVNEVETVDRIAETDIWSPVLNPDYEPWFEVALVIDGSTAMSLWQRLIQDIQRLLRCYGSFRDLRVWQLVVDDELVGIRPHSETDSVVRSPNVLFAPDARRLILVFSDCTADYWWQGTLQPVLAAWGASTPTAIWQVLPEWMWKRTALAVGEYVAVRNYQAGAPNTRLTPVFLSLQGAASRREPPPDDAAQPDLAPPPLPICIPVVTGERQLLNAWSRMLAGDRRDSTPGYVLPPPPWPADTNQDDSVDERLENFRRRATPSARRLAALLSAAPVITLPVMRLIRASDELLPGSSPVPVAEVFLGGLLQTAPDQPPTADVELVQYTFPDEVRNRLLGVLPKVDAIEVIEAVSKHVAERLHCTLSDFRALLLSPDLKDEADHYGLRSFAQMTAQILRRVGPEFRDLVDQLEDTSGGHDSDSETEADTDDWLTGFIHQTLTYTVAEYLDFPPLTDFAFTQAELFEDDDTFPPPLRPDDFKIVTVELQTDSTSAQISETDAYRLLERKEAEIKQLIRQEFEEQEIDFRIDMHPRDVQVENIDESEIEISSEQEIGIELIDTQLIEVGEVHIVFRAIVAIDFAVRVGYFDYESYRSPEQELSHWYQTWSGQTLNGSVSINLEILEDDFEEGLIDAEVDSVDLRPDTPIWVRETTEQERSASDTDDDLSFRAQLIEVRVATLERQAGEWHVVYRTGEVQRYVEPLSDSIELELIAIPGGTFRMGSPEDEPERNANRESPQHDVTVSPFFMGRYPITQAQWRAVANLPQVNRRLNPDPSRFKGDRRPVERVSWHDAVEFCARLFNHTGRSYRLPSEAEWEYACRAGTTTSFHFGDMITTDVANYHGREIFASGPVGEYREETTIVDYFGIANAFALCDMHGNVLEWCADHWHENYDGSPTDGCAWVEDGDSSLHVYRGGSWDHDPRHCRSASRGRSQSDGLHHSEDIGFRVVFSYSGT